MQVSPPCKYRGPEVWRHAAGVEAWSHEGMEVGRRAGGVAIYGYMDSGALESRCGPGDMKAGRCEDALQA